MAQLSFEDFPFSQKTVGTFLTFASESCQAKYIIFFIINPQKHLHTKMFETRLISCAGQHLSLSSRKLSGLYFNCLLRSN